MIKFSMLSILLFSVQASAGVSFASKHAVVIPHALSANSINKATYKSLSQMEAEEGRGLSPKFTFEQMTKGITSLKLVDQRLGDALEKNVEAVRKEDDELMIGQWLEDSSFQATRKYLIGFLVKPSDLGDGFVGVLALGSVKFASLREDLAVDYALIEGLTRIYPELKSSAPFRYITTVLLMDQTDETRMALSQAIKQLK